MGKFGNCAEAYASGSNGSTEQLNICFQSTAWPVCRAQSLALILGWRRFWLFVTTEVSSGI
jgi:hypothetical protein